MEEVANIETARIKKSVRASLEIGGRVERYTEAGQTFCAALYDAIIESEKAAALAALKEVGK